MPYCSNCGEKVEVGKKFCPNCGSSLKPEDEGRAPVIEKGESGPRVLLALAAGCVLVGLVVLFLGVLFLEVSGAGAALFGLILLLLGVASAGTGYAIYRRASWSRAIGNIAGTGYVAFGAFLLIVPSLWIFALASLAMGVGLIVFLRRPSLRKALGI